MRKMKLLLLMLSAATLAFAADIITTTCITKDDAGHTANGGTPLPGTITTADSTTPSAVDGVDHNVALSAPIDLELGNLGLFIMVQ